MEKICVETWSRREAYAHFSRVSNPFFGVTFTMDVTELYHFTRERGISFYLSLVYLCTKALNRVDAFRLAICDGELVRLDERLPSFTDLKPGAEQFHIVTLPCRGSMEEFCREAKEKSAAQTYFLQPGPERGDLIYFSCVPWFELTAVSNERDFNRDDSTPRVTWGKYVSDGERKKLHIAIDINHRFTDGYHIGQFHDELRRSIQAL